LRFFVFEKFSTHGKKYLILGIAPRLFIRYFACVNIACSNLIIPVAQMLKVTVVEDRADYRAFLEKVLGESSDFSVHESYNTATAALVGIPISPPDMLLTDIGMPGMGGVELVSRLKVELPTLKIVMITVFEDDDNVFSALQAGASGYVLKHAAITDPPSLLNNLHEVFNGGSSMSPTIAQRVLEFFQVYRPFTQMQMQSGVLPASRKRIVGKPPEAKKQKRSWFSSPKKQANPAPEAILGNELDALTPREYEILSLLAQGFSDQELADKLHLSVHTVRTHNSNIYEKLQVRTRSEAVARFFKR
jgi:DNA-binding NarL/FixJ family response regulator